jgi:hypothetical protein
VHLADGGALALPPSVLLDDFSTAANKAPAASPGRMLRSDEFKLLSEEGVAVLKGIVLACAARAKAPRKGRSNCVRGLACT